MWWSHHYGQYVSDGSVSANILRPAVSGFDKAGFRIHTVVDYKNVIKSGERKDSNKSLLNRWSDCLAEWPGMAGGTSGPSVEVSARDEALKGDVYVGGAVLPPGRSYEGKLPLSFAGGRNAEGAGRRGMNSRS
jgi:hypothetical protein